MKETKTKAYGQAENVKIRAGRVGLAEILIRAAEKRAKATGRFHAEFEKGRNFEDDKVWFLLGV